MSSKTASVNVEIIFQTTSFCLLFFPIEYTSTHVIVNWAVVDLLQTGGCDLPKNRNQSKRKIQQQYR